MCVCVCMCVFFCAFLWHFFPSRFGFVHIHLCSCTLSSPYRLTGAYICDISEISLCFMQWLYLYAVYDISYGKLFRWCCCRRRRWWLFSPYFFFFIFLLYFIVWLALWTSNDITLTIRQPYTIQMYCIVFCVCCCRCHFITTITRVTRISLTRKRSFFHSFFCSFFPFFMCVSVCVCVPLLFTIVGMPKPIQK